LSVTPRVVDGTACPVLAIRHYVAIDLEDHLRGIADPVSHRDHAFTGVQQDTDVVVPQVVRGAADR
jgi:hypothetical protein